MCGGGDGGVFCRNVCIWSLCQKIRIMFENWKETITWKFSTPFSLRLSRFRSEGDVQDRDEVAETAASQQEG